MKVTGETFSFILKRKGAEEVRCQKYLNFQAKGQSKRVISLFSYSVFLFIITEKLLYNINFY